MLRIMLKIWSFYNKYGEKQQKNGYFTITFPVFGITSAVEPSLEAPRTPLSILDPDMVRYLWTRLINKF